MSWLRKLLRRSAPASPPAPPRPAPPRLEQLAVSYHAGRRLTGLTFGKRGSPAYCRIYDKTLEAQPDAPIRERWHEAGFREAEHGRVWRVEFEVRGRFLHRLAASDAHLPTDPTVLLANHLDDIWKHLLRSWLVFRDPASRRTRRERRPPAPWWSALSATTLGPPGSATPVQLVRRPRMPEDPVPLLKQTAGLLALLGAMNGGDSLDGCLRALQTYMTETLGEHGFRDAVRRAKQRRELQASNPKALRRARRDGD